MNIQVSFDKYMKACYGADYRTTLNATQLKEVEQAFLSGIMETLSSYRVQVSPAFVKGIRARLAAIGSLVKAQMQNSLRQAIREDVGGSHPL